MAQEPSAKAHELIANCTACYARGQTPAELSVNQEVCGAEAEAVHSYATVAQANALAEHLALRPSVRLLDIGSGRGWPGLYLASITGCETFVTDVPVTGLIAAADRARRDGIEERVWFVQATGTDLPFRARVFDAIVHTDVL